MRLRTNNTITNFSEEIQVDMKSRSLRREVVKPFTLILSKDSFRSTYTTISNLLNRLLRVSNMLDIVIEFFKTSFEFISFQNISNIDITRWNLMYVATRLRCHVSQIIATQKASVRPNMVQHIRRETGDTVSNDIEPIMELVINS